MSKPSEPVVTESGTSAESQSAGRSLLFFAIALGVLYCGSLIGLALFTSNPVVLNPIQLGESSLIVSGQLDSSEESGVTLRIEKIWKGKLDTETVFIRNLTATQLNGSDVWIVPLSPVSSGEFIVTPLPNTSPETSDPLLYPAEAVVINKLKSLLSPNVPAS